MKPPESLHLDMLDLKLLKLLQRDAKLTHKELAAQLGLTTTPVYERVKRMEREGVISAYVAIVNRAKVRRTLMAFCEISLNQHSRPYLDEFESGVRDFPEVTGCWHMAGQFDYLLQVVVEDMNGYQQFADRLSQLGVIRQVQSSFVLREVSCTTEVPLGQ